MPKRPGRMPKGVLGEVSEDASEKILKGMPGIGTDIESVARFEQRPYSENKEFYFKLFTEEEIRTCLTKPSPAQSFAARFAAKEAIIKAIPSLNLSLKEIEIEAEAGSPAPAARIRRPGLAKYQIKVSFSHTSDYATAVALASQVPED